MSTAPLLCGLKVPKMVNMDACDLKTLADWKAEIIAEPVFTARMYLVQLDALNSFLHIHYTLEVVREQAAESVWLYPSYCLRRRYQFSTAHLYTQWKSDAFFEDKERL